MTSNALGKPSITMVRMTPSDERYIWFRHINCDQSGCVEKRQTPTEPCSEEQETMERLKYLLRETDNSKLPLLDYHNKLVQLNIIDTGGQPAFQEFLPLIVNGPAIYILVFKANESIKKCYEVDYVHQNGVSTRMQTNITAEEVIMKAISTISTFGNLNKKDFYRVKMGNSAIILVATHCNSSDLTKEERDEQLKELNKKVLNFSQIAGDANGPIITLDNYVESDETSFMKLRSLLTDVIDEHYFTMELPAQWYALYTMLQDEKNLNECVQFDHVERLASKFSIKQDELKDALWILHHVAGVLFYFDDVESLRDKVFLDIQTIFDWVTELIKGTLKSTSANVIKNFKDTGMITTERLEDIVIKHEKQKREKLEHSKLKDEKLKAETLDYKQVIDLLRHLKIIAAAKDGRYFLPCVLDYTELSRPSPNDLCQNAPLLIKFTLGTNPCGLFSSLIIHLIDTKQWELIEHEGSPETRFRNKIVFTVGRDGDTVELLDRHEYYEIRACPTENEKVRCFGSFKYCDILAKVEDSIRCVCKALPYMLDNASAYEYQLGFYCACCCTTSIHPVYLSNDDRMTKRIACNKKTGLDSLSQLQMKWFDVSCKIHLVQLQFSSKPACL